MRTMTRFGIAAAATLAFTQPATPCDPGSYDPKDDAPREQVCSPAEQPGQATTPDVKMTQYMTRAQTIDPRLAGSGSGSGEPDASREEQTDSSSADDSHTGP